MMTAGGLFASGLAWAGVGADVDAGMGDAPAPNKARCIKRVASSSLPTPASLVVLNMAWLIDF
jgi:hypothetical protein